MNVNKVENNKLYMRYYNNPNKDFPDFKTNNQYKKDYLEINKEFIEEYKNNREFWFHQKRKGRPPKWKEEIDKESNMLKRKQGKFNITFN
jgi:hypothetical protein